MGLRPVHGEFGLKIHQVHSLRLGILKIMGPEPSKARSKSTTPSLHFWKSQAPEGLTHPKAQGECYHKPKICRT